MRKLIILLFSLSFVLTSYGEILNVPSGTYPDIQTAIDSSATGDTVLVDQGTYFERLDFSGKNIVVTSRFLGEQDTSYISTTIIDGQSGGSVVTFQSGEDSTAQLIGFTIEHGFVYPGDGAGIHCINSSSPKLRNLIIRNNISGNGAGILAYNDCHLILNNVRITNNSSYVSGAGILCDRNSSVTLLGGEIKHNTTSGDGGALYLNDSSSVFLSEVQFSNNYASYAGGAIFASESSMDLQNVSLHDNATSLQGGGIFFENCYETTIDNCAITANTAEESGGGLLVLESDVTFHNSRIHHNQAYVSGGGIYSAYSSLSFDETERSDIFLNFAGLTGNDLYAETDSPISVQLDTATILPVTGYQVFPIENIEIEALAAKVDRAGTELYVSPDGSDDNDGLSPSTPLGTIAVALIKIGSDSTQPGTIHLQPGTYGNDYNNDYFPLNMRSYTKISGDSPASVVLDGAYLTQILVFSDDHGVQIEQLKIQNADGYSGGAVYMDNSRATFYQTIFQGNNAYDGSALYLENNSRVDLLNTTLVNNPAYGVVYLKNADASIINSIFWLNWVDVIVFDYASEPNSAVIAYSDIEGGQDNLFSTTNGSLYWLAGNIDLNPMFEDSLAFDLNLKAGSPCIDAGRQDTLLLYNSDQDSLRIPVLAYNDNAPDMGALESGVPNSITRGGDLPDRFVLFQNYPNPFNPSTTIRYNLPQISDVKFSIYNNLGQLVQEYEAKGQAAGLHELIFEGTHLASGIYYYIIKAGNFTANRKMLLIK